MSILFFCSLDFLRRRVTDTPLLLDHVVGHGDVEPVLTRSVRTMSHQYNRITVCGSLFCVREVRSTRCFRISFRLIRQRVHLSPQCCKVSG